VREGDLLNLDDEKIAVLLRSIASKKKLSLNRGDCPDEESLATFVSGHFDDESRNQLESHLAICPFCLEDIVAAFKAVEDLDKVAVPERVRARAMALLQSPPDDRVFDFVVRLVGESLELVRISGEWLSTLALQPVVARGSSKEPASSFFQIERKMSGKKVLLEVARVDAELCQVIAKIESMGGTPAEGMRLTLSKGEREQASYRTRHGQAIFESLAAGNYEIAISEAATRLGTIKFKIGDEL